MHLSLGNLHGLCQHPGFLVLFGLRRRLGLRLRFLLFGLDLLVKVFHQQIDRSVERSLAEPDHITGFVEAKHTRLGLWYCLRAKCVVDRFQLGEGNPFGMLLSDNHIPLDLSHLVLSELSRQPVCEPRLCIDALNDVLLDHQVVNHVHIGRAADLHVLDRADDLGDRLRRGNVNVSPDDPYH